jgi:1-acyl-sn-glycerol-3-phosphate acyltransferase
MGKFHPGVAAIYTQLNITVVPVAVNSGSFWPRREFKKKPGKIIIEFLPPIEPSLDRKLFMLLLENRMKIATEQLEKEADLNPRKETPKEKSR